MRQILIGAWLVLASSAIACNGEEFATGSSNDTPATTGSSSFDNESGSKAGRSSAGTSSSSSGGSGSSGGKSSTAGSVGVVPPGVSGSGGSSNPGAGGSDTGVDEAECAEGKVTFKMVPDPSLANDYVCDASCGTGWLTITDANGSSALSIFPTCAAVSCASCEALPCAAAACLPTPLTAEGTHLSWSGASLVVDSCGAGTACQKQTCVPSGKYKAKACANVNAGENSMNGGCMPKDGVMLCSEAEFDFPATSEVVLVLKKP